MVRWWRLTRNRYGRTVYEALKRAGLQAAKMDEYVHEGPPPVARDLPADVRLVERAGDALGDLRDGVASLDGPHDVVAEAAADDYLVVAVADAAGGRGPGRPVGYVLASDRRVYVTELGVERRFDGSYVWRLYVAPEYRRRGVATALVARTVRTAAERFGCERRVALVAADNRPSQWVFEANGFEPERRWSYYRVGPFERRSVAPRGEGVP